MFCRKCGKKLEDDAVFCYSCGEKVTILEEESGAKEEANREVEKESFERNSETVATDQADGQSVADGQDKEVKGEAKEEMPNCQNKDQIVQTGEQAEEKKEEKKEDEGKNKWSWRIFGLALFFFFRTLYSMYGGPSYDDYIVKGRIYASEQKYAQAAEALTKAIEKKPKSSDAYYWRGMVHINQKNYALAIDDFTQAIKLIDDKGAKKTDEEKKLQGKSYVGRGQAFALQGENEKFLQDLSKAIEIDPNNGDAYGYRGVIYTQMDDLAKAALDLGKAIELDPSEEMWYQTRGEMHQKLGNTAQAEADFAKAKELEAKKK